jgi:hypothetical protein
MDTRDYLTDTVEVSETPTIPAGVYVATLRGVRAAEHDDYGTRWIWDWAIPAADPDTGGDFELRVWTPPRFSSTGIASEMAKALGADTSKGAHVPLGELRGRSAQLTVVLDDEKRRNRVKAATPAPKALAPAQADPDYAAFLAAKAAREAQAAPQAESTGHEGEVAA